MEIKNFSLSENMWSFYRANQAHDLQKTCFQKILGNSKSALGSSYDLATVLEPRDQVLEDYRAWKSLRPFSALPMSRGATEENFEYLEKKYGGRKLSIFERIEAVDTMRELGMINEKQMFNAIGLGDSDMQITSNKYAGSSLISMGINKDPTLDKWTEYFSEASIGWPDELSKIYELVDTSLRVKGSEEIAEEIQNVLNQVTSKKAF